MRTIAFIVCVVAVLFVRAPSAFAESAEEKWEVYAGTGYHHSNMKYASDPVAYEVGVRHREGKGSLGLAVLYMQQRIYGEDFQTNTDIDMVRYMALFGYNLFNDFWLDIGPAVTFFRCTDDAKNDLGNRLTMPAQPGGVAGFSYRKHVANSLNIDAAVRSTFGNWEIRGPYAQPENNLAGWEVMLNVGYSF
ncbi:MAG: hypothetical protein U1D31_00410 [Patescibacteria group bacterium]|nr:hypothetical protein [bacterium]MDZ4240583.1 hypothetical protein [Patescibacteria group bacterium]